jgi:hypothetical protein
MALDRGRDQGGETAVDLPDVTYAVLTVGGELRFGRTPSNLTAFETMRYPGNHYQAQDLDEPQWAGAIVITTTEDQRPGERCGVIWPLDNDQLWLIREAYRAALGDTDSMLYLDDDVIEADV